MLEKGSLKEFVIAHVNPTAPVVHAEADRLMPLARKAGLKPTVNSLRQAVRTYRALAVERAHGNGGNGGHGGNGHTSSATAQPEHEFEREWREQAPGHGGGGGVQDIVRGEEFVRRLAEARATLAKLAAEVQAAGEVLAALEADTVSRRQRLERFAQEFL